MNHSRYTSQEEAETVAQVLEKFPRFTDGMWSCVFRII